jgi:hypothetical protein
MFMLEELVEGRTMTHNKGTYLITIGLLEMGELLHRMHLLGLKRHQWIGLQT